MTWLLERRPSACQPGVAIERRVAMVEPASWCKLASLVDDERGEAFDENWRQVDRLDG
jgi:hypothetical protein